MFIFNDKDSLEAFLNPLINQKKTIGFVPTMGALHEGHQSLIKRSVAENEITVISIFVNPTQFNNTEDLEKYPRTLDQDIDKVKEINDLILIYAPTVEDIYGKSPIAEHFNFDGLELQMEGKQRPGHFDGVGTIIKKLFATVKPTRAYFGEKDFQQLQIIKKLVSKEKLPVKIVGCPIHRASSGLAMSSRNERLSADAKEKAAFIYKVLQEAKEQFQQRSAKEVIDFVYTTFEKEPEFELEYFEIADEETLLSCIEKDPHKKYRGFITAFIENIRLIDNIALY
ncbi:pantoate--beta-alanine ligase [Flavobacterium sp. NRK F10]|uniref:pantoate--beta-alanine ligase n=1 Tax=Flavobacterium sp. NRK F10 TaxID=2954931 RepID=UPI002090F241|nr:pantoate--beta-alanine ligase [Flavobacterium sp. NRK F10]MCO6174899.1 pantoate--beta-alanine ligase [Flavobacterium sp. NRK F10]